MTPDAAKYGGYKDTVVAHTLILGRIKGSIPILFFVAPGRLTRVFENRELRAYSMSCAVYGIPCGIQCHSCRCVTMNPKRLRKETM